jgi:hypothetical protein
VGLRVPAESLQQTATNGNWLQRGRFDVATNCNKLQLAETSPYSNPYSQVSPRKATPRDDRSLRSLTGSVRGPLLASVPKSVAAFLWCCPLSRATT